MNSQPKATQTKKKITQVEGAGYAQEAAISQGLKQCRSNACTGAGEEQAGQGTVSANSL